MKNKYFVGKDYKTLKEKNDILESYDKLYTDKLVFLNELYENENTLKRLWSTYIRHIHKRELQFGKDVMFFNDNEIDELIASSYKYSQSTKDGILFFVKTYQTWGMGRGDIKTKSTEDIDKRQITKISKKILKSKVWGLGEFYNLLIDIEKKSTFVGGIAFLLVRYGIAGKELINARQLRWEHIDYENKQVKIVENDKVVRILDVDDRFLQWLDKYKYEQYPAGIQEGYILEVGKGEKKAFTGNTVENYSTMMSRTYRIAKDLKIPRISFGDLLKSRYIDFLLEIRETRKLTTDDINWTLMNFMNEVNDSKISKVKIEYETLTKDEVIKKTVKTKTTKDERSKEFVERIRKEIGFEEFVNGEEKFDNKEIELEIEKEVSTDLENIEN
jgi:integrase